MSSSTENSFASRPKTSGSEQFDNLRASLASDSQLRFEVEALLRLIVETYNPSDRGVR